jgi:hypothetical protein
MINQTWAAQELRGSNFGDARLDRRWVKIVDSRTTERSVDSKHTPSEQRLVRDQGDLTILG